MAVGIAEQYLNDEVLYFPHSYDFRGRVYPIPVGLSPQGSDAIKAMLEYAHGETLNKDGEKWMWAYLASLWGEDKITFDKRVEFGKGLLYASYRDADEPYQFLAHQIELQKYLADRSYRVKARIHLDACNSGSQFTSTITGDRKGCLATNVIPTYKDGGQDRQDSYLLVSDIVKTNLDSYIDSESDKEVLSVLKVFRELMEESGRKICKKPVMVSNYGGTSGGRSEIMWDTMRELKVERKYLTKKNASLFGRIVGDAIVGVLNGGKAFETYIQGMCTVIVKQGKSIEWTTGDGFHVVHEKQKELKSKQVTCLLPNSRKPTTINKKIFSEDLSTQKMKSAISPNFVHSLDAELLRSVALRMHYDGVLFSDWIHDSFGCRPNYVSRMLEITKEEFLRQAKSQPLIKLHEELLTQAGTTKPVLKQIAKIGFPNLGGVNVMNGDIDCVMDSEWFFS